MTPRYKLLKPLPFHNPGEFYKKVDGEDSYIAECCVRTPVAMNSVPSWTVENSPEWFQKVEDAPPYPMKKGDLGYEMVGVEFERCADARCKDDTDLNIFRTEAHAILASRATKQLLTLLRQKWNDEATGQPKGCGVQIFDPEGDSESFNLTLAQANAFRDLYLTFLT